jgi:hypothetical protein
MWVLQAEGGNKTRAAEILGRAPEAMQLRYLSALHDIAGERSSTVVFPFPIDLAETLTAFTKPRAE